MFYPELTGDALAAYNEMRNKLVQKAARELLGISWVPGMPIPEQLVVRPLRPEDLGLTNPEWYFASISTGWNNLVDSKTIADNRFVGIYGVYLNEDAGELEELKITREGTDTRYWPIAQIRYFESDTGYADDPVTIDQNTTVTIQGYVASASTITGFALLGLVAEKKGLLINP